MGEIHPVIPVKLFVGMLSSEPALFETCTDILRTEYGPIDCQSEIMPWKFTYYYTREMGSALLRTFIFFESLMDPGKLADVKILTNRVEGRFALKTESDVLRRINLDPGYLTEAKVVLATTKDYSHRIYIGKNIYADVTLLQKGGRFTPLAHTYPDYRTDEYRGLFDKARVLLRDALREKGL